MPLRSFLVLVAVLFVPSAKAAEPGPADLVALQRGTLPILLTAPHGGQQSIPGVSPRNVEGKKQGPGANQYTLGRDPGTYELAVKIAAEIKALTGRDVYLVAARFDRKFIDANRGPAIAYDNPTSAPHYDLYHRSIREFVDEIRRMYTEGLLIDVHGQHKDPAVLMRGTLNGRAVQHLTAKHGAAAITSPTGLFGRLEANGFAVFPSNSVPPTGTAENGGFNGGYTVSRYGSHNPDGIDAVQFEFGTNYRRKAALDQSAKSAAKAIAGFYESYLKKEPRRADRQPPGTKESRT